ncbi:hypothetical protein HDV00_010790 [Rhizophlyctis rosea]|nr:hypothetical protein HDV00_010790 [Rhizophlyctis rosea]
MEDPENQSIEQPEQPIENAEPPKKKRVISPEAKKVMMENLAKAPEARAANRKNVTKYPKAKRERAKELYEEDIEKKAQERAAALAEELLRKKEEQKELEEYRQWKKSQSSTSAGDEEEEPKELKEPPKKKAVSKAVKATPSDSKKTKGSFAKSVKEKQPGKPKRTKIKEPQSDTEVEMYTSYSMTPNTGFNIDDFLD